MDENAARSSLISADLESRLAELFGALKKDVTLCCLFGSDEKSEEMRVFAEHLVSLSPRLKLNSAVAGEKPEWEQLFGLGLFPATGIWNENGFCRASFHGVPGGHELSSFVTAILAAGDSAEPLDKATLKDIAKIKRSISVEICVSLGCQHCAKLVMAAQRIAYENPAVSAHMIDANLYPELVSKYQIQRVPVVVSNGSVLSVGGMTLFELSALLRKQPGN